MVNVTKADGSKQPFDKNKIVRTAVRMHSSFEEAEEIANKIEAKVYEGIHTKKILQMIFTYLRQRYPKYKHVRDLREAISLLRPKPDFEKFVAVLLSAKGYSVETNKILQGKCVDHEIDVIAGKPPEMVYVEVKHHFQPHTYTGLDVFLETNSALQDLQEGFLAAKQDYNFKKAMIVVNTKISDHAKYYANCRGISYLAWRAPENEGMEFLIEDKKLYPITYLRELDDDSHRKLGDNGIVTIKQLVEEDFTNLKKITKIQKGKLRALVSSANAILAE